METALDRFWELVWGATTLNPEAFRLIYILPLGGRAALYIVLMAGFSQSIAQSIVLFINRVKPARWLLSLLISALLFAVGYLFWAFSTWLVYRLFFPQDASFRNITRALGLAYAPQIWSFWIALPYLGVPISIALSIWSFFCFLIGIQVASGLGTWQAFLCIAWSWVLLQVLQRTMGRPFTALGQWLKNSAAGVPLVTDLKDLERMVEGGVHPDRGEGR
ncbi:MAG: hypothetical protein VKJ46_15725 [Leptolyngbyaceae bacterium]|nr:hypothetical protein [Leptolyngbyaceae bacterium]